MEQDILHDLDRTRRQGRESASNNTVFVAQK